MKQNDYIEANPRMWNETADVHARAYMDPSAIVQSPAYWFPHRMADVIGGCLRHGLDLTHFEEYDHDISATYARFAQFETKPPMCYSLVARKRA